MAAFCGKRQRGVAVFVGSIDIRALFNEQTRDADVPRQRRRPQRGKAAFVRCIHGGAERLAQTKAGGRPAEMQGGHQVNVYLDAISLATAKEMGNGNVSSGIREALRRAREGV